MAVAGRRSRRFVIVKRFMGNYNVLFPREGPSVRPDTKLFPAKYKGGIHWRFSSDRPINDVLLSLHFLILFPFFSSPCTPFVSVGSRPSARRGAARQQAEGYIKFRDQNGHLFRGDTAESPPFLRYEAITSRNDRPPRIYSGYMEACFQIVMVAIRVSSAFLISISCRPPLVV